MTAILGIGHDLTDIADFADIGKAGLAGAAASDANSAAAPTAALNGVPHNGPGASSAQLFSPREWRQARRKAAEKGDDLARHLAACWAGKEAVVKAWTEALGVADFPVSLDAFEWSAVEVLSNAKGCPEVVLSERYRRLVRDSLRIATGREVSWKISVTHSAQLASSVVLLCSEEDALYNRL